MSSYLTREGHRFTLTESGGTDDSIIEASVDKTHTPLQLAARLGHLEAMEALVDEGADLDAYGPSMQVRSPG
jgi:hypothetical protein